MVGAWVVNVTVNLASPLLVPLIAGMEKDVGLKLHAAFAGRPVQANCAVNAGVYPYEVTSIESVMLFPARTLTWDELG
jgi:hypothetical protein